MKPHADIDVEKLEVLDGSRNRDRHRAAVRIEDLTGILRIPATLQSKKSVGVPTKAEFDALYTDFSIMHRQLMAVSERLAAILNP